MLIKCTKAETDRIKEYIGNDYPRCLYLYMDLLQYGSDSEFTKSWIQTDNGEVTCVLLAYHTAMHIFARGEFNVSEVVELVKLVKPSQICAAKSTIIALKEPLSDSGYGVEIGYIGKMDTSSQIDSEIVRLATIHDVDEIAELLYHDEVLGISYTLEDLKTQLRERISQGFVRSFIIKDGDQIVGHLGTGAEVGNVCVVTYVITDRNYRGRGYAKEMYRVACQELHKEGKEIYAVYYVDSAIKLHHKVGFKDYCEYGKLFLKTH